MSPPFSSCNWSLRVRKPSSVLNPIPTTNAPLFLSDHSLYGPARLGQRQQNKIVNQSYVPPGTNNLVGVTYVQRGWKAYELSNHLGNVLSVISDRKEAGHCNDTLVAFYYPDIIQNNDYYPFGSPMEGRGQQSKAYRFGFNGKEKEDNLLGDRNAYDFGARIYDSRLGRWMSVDPLMAEYPSLSPLIGFASNPILFIDPDGRKIDWANMTSEAKNYIMKTMMEDPKFSDVIQVLDASDVIYHFHIMAKPEGDKYGYLSANPDQNQININFTMETPAKGWQGSLYNLYHETEHAMQFEHGEIGFKKGDDKWVPLAYDFMDEIKAHEFGLTSAGSERAKYNWEGQFEQKRFTDFARNSKTYKGLLHEFNKTGLESNLPEHIEGNDRTIKSEKFFYRTHVKREK